MSIVRIITEVVFDYNTETKECTPVSQKVIGESSVTPKKTTKSKNIENTQDNPGLIREDGKLILSEETVVLLGINPEDRVFIGYDKFGSSFKPFIGTDDKKGNKLTKTNTVSYRGKANEELATYGNKFTLTPGKHNGTFYLEGDVKIDYIVPEEIEVKEIDDISIDVPFDLDLDDTKAKQITSFTFDDIDLE